MKQDLLYFLPELVLIGVIFALFAVDFFCGNKSKKLFPIVALIGFAIMLLANGALGKLPSAHFFSGMVSFDPMSRFFNTLFGLAGILGIILSHQSPDLEKTDQASYYTFIVALVLGMMLLASSNHLLMVYLSLEMVSVLSYILTGSLKGVRRSSEAALKYVIYGGVASGIMAYGISILYGLTGSLDLTVISNFLQNHAVSRPLLFTSVLLIMAGFGYKVASVPFHMWCPDVYEGAPTAFTAFLSVGPKAAGFAALIRFFFVSLSSSTDSGFVPVKAVGWPEMLAVLSMATMTVGNLAALSQKNMKRLLAYSSIAHAGYMLMGLAALNQEAIAAINFYLVVYLIMNIGAFLVVILLSNQWGVETIDGYRGLGRRGGMATILALMMAIFLFSLTGIPPMAGFAGKFYLFGAVIRAGLYPLAIVGVINSAISLYYYVRVIKVMFFELPTEDRSFARPALSQSVVLSVLAFLTLYLGLFWNDLAQLAARSTGIVF